MGVPKPKQAGRILGDGKGYDFFDFLLSKNNYSLIIKRTFNLGGGRFFLPKFAPKTFWDQILFLLVTSKYYFFKTKKVLKII